MDVVPGRAAGGRWSRESRFLLLVVAVCAGVLLVLARMRFPDPTGPTGVAPPLERLAARASYDALAGDIQRVAADINANIVVLRVGSHPPDPPPTRWNDLVSASELTSVKHIAALRTGADTAMGFMDAAVRVESVIGESSPVPASLLHRDPIREWALLRVPAATPPRLRRRALADLPTPTYVVVVEGTQAGTTLRPVFLGQGTPFSSARWSRPLLPLGGIAIAPGALIFTLDGEFVGAVTVEGGAPAVVGEGDLFDAAARLESGAVAGAGDIGISVQPLTSELARALATARGVVVADVDRDGPAAAVLTAGDVVTALDGRTLVSVDELVLNVAQRAAGETVDVSFVRAGESRTASISVRALAPTTAAETVDLVRVSDTGTRVEAGAQIALPGLQPGDVVTRAGETVAPTPAQLRSALTQPTATGFVTLLVQRNGRQRVIAVPVAAEAHAAAR